MTEDAPTTGPGADPAPGDPQAPTPPTAGDILRDAEAAAAAEDAQDAGTPEPRGIDDGDALPEPTDHDADPRPDAAAATTPVVVGPERSGPTAGLAPMGAGLLGAAVAISAARSRADGDLDVSVLAVGVGASALLILLALFAVAGARRVPGGRPRADAVTWPGVIGIIGAVVMLQVGVDSDERWFAYLDGGLVAGLGVIGYLLARRAAFVVTAIAGLALVYGLAFEDLVADSVDGASDVVVLAGAVGAFVVLVTLVGWALPTRVVTGVSVGAAGVAAFGGILAGLVALRALGDLFSGLGESLLGGFSEAGLSGGADPLPEGLGGLDGFGSVDKFDPSTGFADPSLIPPADTASTVLGSAPTSGSSGSGGSGPFGALGDIGFSTSDVWWVLGFAAALTVLWALAAWISNHTGFAVLATVMPVVTVPLGAAALAVEHPTYWAAAAAASGAVLVLGAALLAKRRAQRHRDDSWDPTLEPEPWPPVAAAAGTPATSETPVPAGTDTP